MNFKNSIVPGLVFMFLLTKPFNIVAQKGVQQRFFTSQNGLKISWVNSITKSPNGDLIIVHSPNFYFAEYDGYMFNYNINHSGIHGKTYQDFNENFWSIDENNLNSVSFYSNNSWQNLRFNAGIPSMPTPGMGNKLLFIKDGDLKEFDENKTQTRVIKQTEESKIGRFIDMKTFQDGSVWITGENGIAKYQATCDTCDSSESWTDFRVPKALGLYHFSKPFEGENSKVTLIAKSLSSKQNILVGFDGKIWEKLYVPKNEDVYCGWRGHNNSLWIIKRNSPPSDNTIKDWDLLHVQHGQEELVEKNRILNRILNDILVEPNGNFWLATGSGLVHFSPTLWRKQYLNKVTNNRIKKIHEDSSGRLWLAMENSFSLFINNKWTLHKLNPGVFSGDICALKNGLSIVGSTDSGGLALFNIEENKYTISFPFGNEKVRYYNQNKNGNCFIVLQNTDGKSRLIRYDGNHIEKLAENLQIENLAPGECEITDIIQTSEGDIWIVTFTNILLYKNGNRQSFNLKETFDWGLSTAILELENGNIWISGNKGILQYDGKNWSLVQTPEFETARMMMIDKDSTIWVASGTGVHRLINGRWISNSKEEGLPDAVIFDILKDKQGKIWAAASEGLYCFFPEEDNDPPETYIPEHMNPHNAIPSGDIQFIFHGLDKWDYTVDNRLLYSYRIDKNSWSPFENKTTAKSVGLSYGSHVFEVRAMDRNGNIDPTPAAWSFTVLLPWYLETHFIILLVIILIVIFFLIRFAITRHLQVEKLVLIRTAELEKTKEKAEESDRLKSAFLANMSHEIRTPMNGILGFSNLLKDKNLTGDQQQKYISMIEKGGDRMLNIINNIINISKIESNQMDLNIQKSDINEQIEYIYTFFKPEIEGKGMNFSFTNGLPSKEAIIKTDREKVFSILTNLVKNAIKYSEAGSIELGYSKKRDFLEFYVKDTGIGIPKERQYAIFERFIQADIEDKNAYQGAGLGLSISKAYVEMLGGEIWLESQVGSGSTFYFTIPYVTETINMEKEVLPSDFAPSPGKLKILIAEDDEISSDYINAIVQKIGKEIISVASGAEAVEACLQNPDIDIVLMDILMPNMDGLSATQKIREFNKDVIIIAQTAYALSGDKEKAIKAGCNDYISKPIHSKDLLKKIEKNLKEVSPTHQK